MFQVSERTSSFRNLLRYVSKYKFIGIRYTLKYVLRKSSDPTKLFLCIEKRNSSRISISASDQPRGVSTYTRISVYQRVSESSELEATNRKVSEHCITYLLKF